MQKTEHGNLWKRFRVALTSFSPTQSFVLGRESFVLGQEGEYSLYYVPFEYLNASARLVLVGITPGPEQMKCAYAEAHRLLLMGVSETEALRQVKQSCGFKGMRDKINEMLDHFEIPSCLGVPSASLFWTAQFNQLHATSIVPNAAFKGDAYFNGPFNRILDIRLLREQFEEFFVPSIHQINSEAVYIGMGPVVDDALRWCVERRILNPRQVLGYFPHASGQSGSQFAYFMRRRKLSELSPKDPVRYRVPALDAAYERMRNNVRSWCPKASGSKLSRYKSC